MLAAAFALLLLAGSASAVCQSYDQSCTTTADCCTGLVCDSESAKCTQPDLQCSIMPDTYVQPSIEPGTGATAGGPTANISQLEGGTGIIGAGSGIYGVGWFSDWTTAGLIGIAIALSVIAIAAIVGHSFNLPEVKAFVDAELMQAVVSVLLIVSLIGLVEFFDVVAREALVAADLPTECTTTSPEPCYITAARFYLTTLYDTGKQYAGEQLSESIRNQAAASFGLSTQLNFWQLLYAGGTIRQNAGMSIPAERAGAIFDTVSKLLASLYAQRYFVDVVSFGIAPIFLLLGIVLRTFFFTRKLGGLLLAIAISLFIIYPLTYSFAWYTLNVTIYGERTFAAFDPYCPAECTARYPVAFFVNSTGNGELVKFDTTQELIRAGINDSNWDSGDVGNDGTIEFPGLVACRDLSKAGVSKGLAQYDGDKGFGSGILVARPDSQPGAELTDAAKTWEPDELKGYLLKLEDGESATIEGNIENRITVRSTTFPTSGTFGYQVMGTSCSGCPDYCRDVPFPSTLPGCDIAKCSGCNAGCKIVRQRDCNEDCPGSTCPLSCRTKLPMENKCYFADEIIGGTDIHPANLSVSCGSCSVCPAWCKFITNATGTPELVYKDDTACSTCNTAFANSLKNPPEEPYCPSQCMYLTEIGKSSKCDILCTDQQTGVRCPDYCRLDVLSNSSWMSIYDVDPPSLAQECLVDARIAAACSVCPSECKTEVPAPPQEQGWLAQCAAYPQIDYQSGYCHDCPEYCRYQDYSFITEYSNVGTDAGGTPDVCLGGRLNCDGGGSPAACDSSCKQAGPPTCRDYNGDAGEPDTYCRKCPAETRITLTYLSTSGGGNFTGPPQLRPEYICNDASCSAGCRRTLVLPNEITHPSCEDEATTGCPYGCRVIGIDSYLDPLCPALCAGLSPLCKVVAGGPNSGYICNEYLGNGDPDAPVYYMCYGVDPACTSYGDQSECESAGCSWLSDNYKCYGEGSCDTYADQTECESAGCSWLSDTSIYVPIDLREDPYVDRTSCRQCPENCRIDGYYGDCGVIGNADNQYVDCSEMNCPSACRVSIPVDPPPPVDPGAVCQAFIPSGLPCENCPAACRGDPSQRPADCPVDACGPYDSATGVGCTLECQFPAAPTEACGNCIECDLDCTYYPAVRTDCSEICSDEALAGPVNIAPDDFLKSLPGAKGASDVKNVGVLMVPALVLPLFCIVIVVAFIRVFSPILGGDMDIPGLGKII